MFGPVSGGHFNPVVSLVDASFGGIRWRDALAYVPAQVAGCVLGAIVANGMFSLAAVSISTHHRASPAHLLLRGDRDRRPAARDLLARAHQTRAHRPGGGRRLHRRRLLLHQLGQLRQPGDQRRADVLQHLRRHRARVGARASSSPSSPVALAAILIVRMLYPDVTPADAAEAVVPHHGQDPASTATLRTSPRPATDERRMATVLFVCLQNAGRSQMSQALFERAAAGRHRGALGRHDAGRRTSIPRSSRSMRELGIDLSDRTPQTPHARARRAGGPRRHDGLRRCTVPTSPASATSTGTSTDPNGLPLDRVRAIRDDIARRVSLLLAGETLPGSML